MPTDEDCREQRETAFTVERIRNMVHEFYALVRRDELIGPVFEEHIDDWPPHLDRMVLFWRAVLRSERTFTMSARGGPPALHRAIEELDFAHFERWLTLFGRVADDIYEPDAAALVKQTAARIGGALSRHLRSDDAAQ